MHQTQDYGTTVSFAASHDGVSALPLLVDEDNAAIVRFRAPAGLYQFSVVADARDFDWEELYENLYEYNNSGQRTGPWDFKLGPSYPLIPAYWAYLDGHKIGLWFFARVSLEDLAAKRFRGRMAFWLREGDSHTEHELKLVPYRPLCLSWLSAHLEEDPEDTLLPTVKESYDTAPQFLSWSIPGFWDEKRAQLETTHSIFSDPLRAAFDAALQKEETLPGAPKLEAKAPNEWIVLLTAYRLGQRPQALEELLRAIDEQVALPHWGNQREDGYSHDGDMHAAFPMRALAWAYHGLGEELGDERRQRICEKLAVQGERFVDLCLLNRDYWGGSLMQDHGWRSVHTFTTASLSLLNIIPQARQWLRYFLPRAQRALRAMPRDGMVPISSYSSFTLYLDDIGDLREVWLAWNGEDIYDCHPFHEIVDYVLKVRPGATPAEMLGGNAFFNQIAQKYSDGRAAWIQHRLLQTPELNWSHFMQRQGYYFSALRGFLTYDPQVQPCEPAPLQAQELHFFSDSGLVQFADTENDILFSVFSGPWVGHHAYRFATGPCDRMGITPGEGHFTIRRGQTPLLATPDSAYALQSVTRSCLLIDGLGQYGDIGYPMSIPSKLHRGEEIESVRWDQATRTGRVRQFLTPAYPPEAGVAHYTREFLISPQQIIVRDHVVLTDPKPLSWLFQGKREVGIELLSTLQASFGGREGVTLHAHPVDFSLRSAIHPTPVVWSYSSDKTASPFDHVRFDSRELLKNAVVDFIFRW